MSIHYNAFISYRHHPDDIRVASEIHRSLERFRAPKSIRLTHGKIERLFRDKEELPITSNLSDDIGTALRNSDFLIVICSVHTKESVWVQREIELFLTTHDRSRVLTVLASGEPYDVIPEILLYEYVEDPLTGEKIRRDVEPLSCDWRMKRKKAVREELPRLAAALLGCGYDELRQRQKQYRFRRNMAILSTALAASVCLSAYFLYTTVTIHRANLQIQANLEKAQINQSMHLATAAGERLANGDRLAAISLAQAALPGEDNPRPYVPEAEKVLADALGVYNTASRLSAVGTVSPGMNIGIQDFRVTDSEKVLYLYDQRHTVTAWDTVSLQKLGQIPLEAAPEKLLTLPDDSLLIVPGLGEELLRCFSPAGQLLWQREQVLDVVCHGDDGLLALCRSGAQYELVLLDWSTGTSATAIPLPADENGLAPANFVADSVPAGVPAAVRFSGLGEQYIRAVDLSAGTVTELEAEDIYSVGSLITDDGKLLLMGSGDGMGMAGIYEGNRITEVETGALRCYDLATGRQLWENWLTACIASGNATVLQIPGRDQILCQRGNAFLILDKQTGAEVAFCEAGSGIVAVTAGEQYATAILQDGFLCKYWYDFNYCYEVKCMLSGVEAARIGSSCYTLTGGSDSVTVSRDVKGSPEWDSGAEVSFAVNNLKTWGDYLAFQDSSSLYLYDTGSRSILWQTEKGSRELLGFSADGATLWYAEDKSLVTAVDIAAGSCEVLDIRPEGEASVRGGLYLSGECLHYILGGIPVPELTVLDLRDGSRTAVPLILEGQEDISGWHWEILAAREDTLWLWANEKLLLEVDLTDGGIRVLLEETDHRPVIALQGSEYVALAHQGSIVLSAPGQDAVTVSLDGANAGSLYFLNGELLALCDNGFLYRFGADGAELSRTALEVSGTFASNLFNCYADRGLLGWYLTEDNELILNALGDGNIISCESWSLRAGISGLLSFNGRLICRQGNGIAAYPLYTTEQLLQLAKTELGGFRLTQEQKAAYGID